MRRSLIFFLYRAMLLAASPILIPYLLVRIVRQRAYARYLGERFGRHTPSEKATDADVIWLHAVSVGEIIAAAGLIRELKQQLPFTRMCVSTTTLAGREVAEQRLRGLADEIFYAPLDYVLFVRRVLRRLQPQLVIILETEIWPNLWREVKRSGATLLIVNGRISDKAESKYRRFAWFFRPILTLPDRVLVQSAVDAERYQAIGANPEIAGNLKYDFAPGTATIKPELRAWSESAGQVFVAASTMPPAHEGDVDEDDVVLDAWTRLQAPGRRLVLVPRKPERFDVAASKLSERQLAFKRRSTGEGDGDVLLLDTMGELASLFQFADVVFMGGTLAARGGHNILEPAAFGKPVVVGPHMENFREIADHFRANQAIREIATGEQLAGAVEELLVNSSLAREMGERAQATAETERGATARATRAAVELYDRARPRPLVNAIAKPFLWLLSLLWRAGVQLHRTFSKQQRLQTPVISVGGLSMGGSGKTPLVRELARMLSERGHRVAILTRGYQRRSREPLLLEPGAILPPEQTGDEAQLYLRDGCAFVAIGSDRYANAVELERRFQPDLFLLDDGFQHWKLARDLDIVVLDGESEVFPLGRAREPLSALNRADVVTPKTLVAEDWEPPLPAGAICVAFCGIGRPASFWRMLDRLAINPVRRLTYPDHYQYSVEELRKMVEGTDALLTTEKDLANCPTGFPVHALRVRFVLPDGLMEQIEKIVKARMIPG